MNTHGPQKTEYDGVIPTGWLTAYGRTFSDIPYAVEIFDVLESIRIKDGPDKILDEMKDTQLAPQFEARHKILNKLIKQTGIKQILEVAAGISTRGLEMSKDETITYVEVDLPKMMLEKRNVIRDFLHADHHNLYIEDGNAVVAADLLAASRHFDLNTPIVVVNEGLLRYLSFDAKMNYANNVKSLLRKFGGVWITSDISLPKIFYKEDDVMKLRRKRISEITGINVSDNLFTDEADAKSFFNQLGFSVESHSFLEVSNELVSPHLLNMPDDYVEAINGSAVVFVMRLI